MIFTDETIHLAAKAYDNITENTVIHVLTALPGDLPRIDIQRIALLDVIVQHRSQQIVG